MPRGVKKQHLPSKTCPVCRRPFVWRKKWSRHWPQVKYCSQRCARHANKDSGWDRSA